jgi:hypothetical protein
MSKLFYRQTVLLHTVSLPSRHRHLPLLQGTHAPSYAKLVEVGPRDRSQRTHDTAGGLMFLMESIAERIGPNS